MSELPFVCQSCGNEQMVNLETMERKPTGNIATALGFTCQSCGSWVRLYYTTHSLDEAFMKLSGRAVNGFGFLYHFAKTLKKAEGIQERYGAV